MQNGGLAMRISGRLGWTHPDMALSAAAGGLLGLLRMC
jgi:hypothetical protein